MFRWFISIGWALVRKKPISWGKKLQELIAILGRLTKGIFKKSLVAATPKTKWKPGDRIRNLFKRLRK